MSVSVASGRHQSPCLCDACQTVAPRGAVSMTLYGDWSRRPPPPPARHRAPARRLHSLLSRATNKVSSSPAGIPPTKDASRRRLVKWSAPSENVEEQSEDNSAVRDVATRDNSAAAQRQQRASPAAGPRPTWRRHRRPLARVNRRLSADLAPDMSSSFTLKDQHQQQHHLHQQHHQQHPSSSFSVQDILCSSLDDYYSAATAAPSALSATGPGIVVKDAELGRASGGSVAAEVRVQRDHGVGGSISEELAAGSSAAAVRDCDLSDQYSDQIAAAAAFYAGSNAALYNSMSSSGSGAGSVGACSPHRHTLHHHNHHHHHPHHHPAAAAAAAAFASQYAGAPTPAELSHYAGSCGTAGFSADSMPVRGCVGGPWYAPSPASDPRLTSKLNDLELNWISSHACRH